MITFDIILDDDNKRVYQLNADGVKGKVIVDKANDKAVYSGGSMTFFPPKWVEEFAVKAAKTPESPKHFAYGFG